MHPAMARSLVSRCQQAKHRRRNPALQKQRVKHEPALQLERNPAKAEHLSGLEKSAAPLAISSVHAGTRCQPCSYEHRGSTKQR